MVHCEFLGSILILVSRYLVTSTSSQMAVLCTYPLRQLVTGPTRMSAILDKIYSSTIGL